MISDRLLQFFFAIPDWVRFMPIFVCSVVLLAIIVDRTIFFRRIFFRLSEQIDSAIILISSGKSAEAADFSRKSNNILMNVIADYYEKTGGRENLSYLQFLTDRCQQQIEKYMGAVSTLASIAPMFGLLGTVSGIMRSFGGLAQSGSPGQDLLALGIAEALLTTAFGLLVAIPALIYYNYMVSRSASLVQEVELLANRILSAEDEKNKA